MNETVPSLLRILAQVPDPRARRGQRRPWTALLSGANTQQAIARWGQHAGWARLRRLLQRVDVPALEHLLRIWQQQVRAATAGCSRYMPATESCIATVGATCGRQNWRPATLRQEGAASATRVSGRIVRRPRRRL